MLLREDRDAGILRFLIHRDARFHRSRLGPYHDTGVIISSGLFRFGVVVTPDDMTRIWIHSWAMSYLSLAFGFRMSVSTGCSFFLVLVLCI